MIHEHHPIHALIQEAVTDGHPPNRWTPMKEYIEAHQAQLFTDAARAEIRRVRATYDPDSMDRDYQIPALERLEAFLLRCQTDGIDVVFAPLLERDALTDLYCRLPEGALWQQSQARSLTAFNAVLRQYPLLEQFPDTDLARLFRFENDVLFCMAGQHDPAALLPVIATHRAWLDASFVATLTAWYDQGMLYVRNLPHEANELAAHMQALHWLSEALRRDVDGDHTTNLVIRVVCTLAIADTTQRLHMLSYEEMHHHVDHSRPD